MSERAAEALINSVPETVQAAQAAPSFDEAFTLLHLPGLTPEDGGEHRIRHSGLPGG